MFLRMLFVIVLVSVAGCGTVGTERVSRLAVGTSIVPLSLMGDRIAIGHVGTTIFQNSDAKLESNDWQLDRHIEASISRWLGAGGKFRPISTDTAEVRRKVQDLGHGFSASTPFRPDDQNQADRDLVTTFARNAGADDVLVISPGHFGDPFFGTSYNFTGYGVAQRSLFGFHRAVDYAMIAVTLYDGRSGELVAETHSYDSELRSDDAWLDSERLVLTGKNVDDTKASLLKLIDDLLLEELVTLNLITSPGN